MRTTTHVFQFAAEASPDALESKIQYYSEQAKSGLEEFFAAHGIASGTNNLVSESLDRNNLTRTVVREWADLETAAAWVDTCLKKIYPDGDSYPGQIIDAVVNPE